MRAMLMLAAPLLLATPLLLAGCASPAQQAADRQVRLNHYIGMSEIELARDLGPPAARQMNGAATTLVYSTDYSEWVPGSPFDQDPPELVGLQYHAIPPRHLTWVCETRFDIVGGKVAAARQRGNYCAGTG